MTDELTDKIVLVGDSLTEYWNWSDLGQRLSVVNQGIGGDPSMGVISRVSHAAALKPRVISLQVGINDLSQGLAPQEIAENHLDILKEIKRLTPKTHLVVSSLMPIRPQKLAWASDTLNNGRIRATNRILKANLDQARNGQPPGIWGDGGLSWLDLYGLCADLEGELPDHMTDDAVHLTWLAYWAWTEALRDHLQGVLAQA